MQFEPAEEVARKQVDFQALLCVELIAAFWPALVVMKTIAYLIVGLNCQRLMNTTKL